MFNRLRKYWASLMRPAPEATPSGSARISAPSHLRRLLPMIRARADIELDRLAVAPGDHDKVRPFESIGHDLALELIVASTNSRPQPVTKTLLKQWSISWEQALQIAIENLAKKPITFGPVAAVHCFSEQDGFDATRLVLAPPILQHARFRGVAVAVLPNHDRLVIGSSKNADSVSQLGAVLQDGLKTREFLSLSAHIRANDMWNMWLPPESHESFRVFKFARVCERAIYYKKQAEAYRAYAARELPAELVEFQCIHNGVGADINGCCTWSPGVPALLPKTELITLTGVPAPGWIATCRWSDVVRVAGRLLKPQGWHLERYLVEEFPTDEEVAELVKIRVSP